MKKSKRSSIQKKHSKQDTFLGASQEHIASNLKQSQEVSAPALKKAQVDTARVLRKAQKRNKKNIKSIEKSSAQKLSEKDQVISWLSGGYSVENKPQ